MIRSRLLAIVLVSLALVGCQLHRPSRDSLFATPIASPTVTASPAPTRAPTAPPTVAVVQTATATAYPSPSPVPVPPTIPVPPPRDLAALHRQLGPAASTVGPTPPPATRVTGEELFWIANQVTRNYFSMPARRVYHTAHTTWYVQDGVSVSAGEISAAADYFENKTYPAERRLFGGGVRPGFPERLTILVGHIPGVGGYFSSADEYPREVNPYSNQRTMIYINVDSVRPGSPVFNHTVAHEFMHMIQFAVHPDQNSWIDEGSAELAAQAVTGMPSSTIGAFERAPETQLNAWANDPAAAVPHYGAAYLFMRYVAEHYGGYAAIGKVVADPGRGVAAFANYFRTLTPPTDFPTVFADWVAANYLNDSQRHQGRYGYSGLRLHPQVRPGPALGQTVSGSVTQFGTTYYQIKVDRPADLVFRGAPWVQVIGADPHDAPFAWWSNRGDAISTRMTRTVDLRGVTAATLHFWAWYDIEDGYDYAYVEVSTDGGVTWKTLPASTTTTTNPSGQNFGNGFTGESGGKTARWVPESVDLRPFAGQRVQLRFAYVTDDSYNGDGLALDGITIPEISWSDSATSDDGWQTEGFVRIDNREPQPYLLEVLDPIGPSVTRVTVGSDGAAMTPLAAGRSYVVAIAGMAPLTTHRASYSLAVAPR